MDANAAPALLAEHGPTDFVGNEHLRAEAKVVGILDRGRAAARAGQGEVVDLVVNRTTFYAEGSGQVGDRGSVRWASGRADVLDTRPLVPGLTGHRLEVREGEIAVGDEVELTVDEALRRGCERAHTAAHVVHWAVRDRLGEHATRVGCLVEPGRLRLDFDHPDGLDDDELAAISREVQARVTADDDVRAYETSSDYARSIGAWAAPGEDRGGFVRVVEVGDYSKELCGGTHVARTGEIGAVLVRGVASVAESLWGIEASVGPELASG